MNNHKMNKIDEIAKKIAQAIEKANSAYIYSSECGCIVKMLSELRDRVSDFPNQSNDDELDAILTQLNNLCNIFDSFRSDNWSQTSLRKPVENIISSINETMNSLIQSLKEINIALSNEYSISIDNISDDLNIIYGKLADPVKLNEPEVKDKLDEIQQYLTKIGKPITSSSQRKKDLIIIKSDSKGKKSSSIETSSSSMSCEEDEPDKFCDFNNIQKYKLQKSDYTQEPRPLIKNDRYSIYKGKMKLSKEYVTIMVLNQQSYDEDKFKRLVNVLTAVKHPNLDSFVGAVDSPLPCAVVTRLSGEKLSKILKQELKQKGKVKKEEEENEENDQITIKPGYRTIIAFQIASAMAYLHSLNITHRDLCTDNIMIDKELNPRITNFANARFIPENILTMSFKPSSSCEFKAPEITDVEGYDQKVDIFSFSGILYELLTDTVPFSDKKNPDVESLIRCSERPKLPDDISPDLKNLIESCWEQEPEKRPPFTEIVHTMLTNSIIFPQDQGSDVLMEFYATKKIKNVDFQACFDLFKQIQIEINNSDVYEEEATRIRTFLYGYQNELQSSEYANKDEIKDENVNTQISNLRISLQSLLSTLKQTESDKWSTIAIITPVLEIPNDLHQFMEQIFISLSSIGLNVNKYDFVDHDLIWDLRFIYSIIKEYQDEFEKAIDRMNEIQEFMDEKDCDINFSQTEKDETIKSVLSYWKDYEVKRSDFKKSFSRLGSGASCQVFKATQISTKKPVALKVISGDKIEDKDGMKLLRREIGTLVQLNNDYLIKFVGFNCDPGEPLWIISEYVKGGSLYKAIKTKKINPYLKTKFAFEIAQGMEYLRSKRVIHRDLKTENILIEGDIKSNNAIPKICDFGFARADLSLRMSNRTGTVNYMAPEVINGNIYDYKADVFSYGMILWELYADVVPFHGLSQEEVFLKIQENTPLQYKKLISDDLRDLIEDAKNFDPEKRPSFTEIINRMLDNRIAFNGVNSAMIDQFYEQKARERNSK